MLLDQFNGAARDDVLAVLRPCIDISRWTTEIADARPFASVEALLQCAQQAANPFTDAEVDAAMAHHPRIGERAQGDGAEATLARSEQSGVDPTDQKIAQALAEGNTAYEQKFDQVFLIRAAGRSAGEILAALEERLANTPEEEQRIVAEQLREIALLRLKGVISA